MRIIEAYKQNKNLSAAEIHSIFQAPNYYIYRRNVSIRPFIWMLAELDGARALVCNSTSTTHIRQENGK